MNIDSDDVRVILVTDVGSTTTKARLIMRMNGEYRFVVAGEAPTTVEAPFEDVTMGVRNALREVEELIGLKLLTEDGVIKQHNGGQKGVDIYVSTSSAGGGLQMMCAGVTSLLTAESAQRAALGAGAIVFDVISTDDGRKPYQKITRIRNIRPDMILLAGGTDGGDTQRVSEIAELIVAAEPKSRLGDFNLPIVYAGNRAVRQHIRDIMGEKFSLRIVDNIRPVLEEEHVEPAREAVHEFFMEHVMKQAPGYDKLVGWVDAPIMPTPWGEGRMVQEIAGKYKCDAMGVGLGGATTNVYSIFGGKFNRTVSANLGMSYSICNVMKEAGIANIMRWIYFKVGEVEIRNMLRNKMIRPTTIPQTKRELIIEHAVAREALRLALKHHKTLAVRLRGFHRERSLDQIFGGEEEDLTIVDMMSVKYVVGTGGLLSHAPRRVQAELILIDGFQPEGVTTLAQDSIFMIPHLGVLSTVLPKAAMDVFEKDCLIWLGTCVAPKGEGKEGNKIATIKVKMPDGTTSDEEMVFGTMKRIPLAVGEVADVEIRPSRGFDVGAGDGKTLKTQVQGGVVGITLDARGRPMVLPEEPDERIRKIREWLGAMEAYQVETLERPKSAVD